MRKLPHRLPFLSVAAYAMLCAIAFFAGPTSGATKEKKPAERSGFITTSDGVKIHYVEAGRLAISPSAQIGNPMPKDAVIKKGEIGLSASHQFPSILFVPGWTMPGWIWQSHIDYFSHDYRVVAMDPRAQGQSSQTSDGLYPAARARDIKAVVDQLHLAPVVIVSWSMAVVETMAYVDQFGTKDVAGLVLIDDVAGGNEPGDEKFQLPMLKGILEDRKNTADYFVRKVQFHRPQPEDYIQKVIASSLTVPTSNAVTLLVGRFAADYRTTLPKIDRPTMICAAKPNDFYQREVAMKNAIPNAQIVDFEGDGHALFVDEPDKFNAAMEDFLLDLN